MCLFIKSIPAINIVGMVVFDLFSFIIILADCHSCWIRVKANQRNTASQLLLWFCWVIFQKTLVHLVNMGVIVFKALQPMR
ncbi:hypothetical protein BDR26DRAFT_858206 [Obelidium mucronatum]|nr:hypothetical protein BDR26DRAFT_858206 [Obelidium mucronatum]